MWAYTDDKIEQLSRRDTPPLGGIGATFQRFLAPAVVRLNPLHWLRVWQQREAMRQELYGLDDRALADLGINHGDFHAILAGRFRRDV